LEKKKLKEVVDEVPGLSDDDKKKMKKYTEEITKFSCYTECVGGMDYFTAVSKWTTAYKEKKDAFGTQILKRGFDEYPYVEIPN